MDVSCIALDSPSTVTGGVIQTIADDHGTIVSFTLSEGDLVATAALPPVQGQGAPDEFVVHRVTAAGTLDQLDVQPDEILFVGPFPAQRGSLARRVDASSNTWVVFLPVQRILAIAYSLFQTK